MPSKYYFSSYCNFPHRVSDGKPVQHECRILPIEALKAEMNGDIQTAIEILSTSNHITMPRGVKS